MGQCWSTLSTVTVGRRPLLTDQAPSHGAVLVDVEHSDSRPQAAPNSRAVLVQIWGALIVSSPRAQVAVDQAPGHGAVLVHVEHSDSQPQAAPNSRAVLVQIWGALIGIAHARRWQWTKLPVMGQC